MTPAHHILLVEDESAIAEMIRTALEGAGLRVTGCPGVQSALYALDQDTVDLAVMDLSLPDGTPDRLVQRLTARGIPLIAISGDPIRLSAFPPSHTLEKPFRIRALLDLVRQMLDRAA